MYDQVTLPLAGTLICMRAPNFDHAEPIERRLSVLQSRVCCCRFFENQPTPYRTRISAPGGHRN